jgi:hypothetical protein
VHLAELAARALLAMSEPLRSRLAEPPAYGEIDLEGRRRRAARLLADVEAIAVNRIIGVDVWETLASFREMLTRVSDDDLAAAYQREREKSDAALADADAFIASLSARSRPAPEPRRTSLDTDRSLDLAELLGTSGTAVGEHSRADLTMDGFDVVDGNDGFDVVQATAQAVVTLSTGHASEGAAWSWLAQHNGDAVD